MNAPLPAGIESYLSEAGFSATEMLLLKKLVEEDTLTLRELALKTGKSTGVLDQAMKKLLAKGIARRDQINGQPKFTIQSLKSVVEWVKRDMAEREALLQRKHQNFEAFIASLIVDKKRPEMEYFQGLPGIEKAYTKLLESGQELLTQTPILTTAEDDPLRDFRVQYFRRRQVKGIFQRIIAADTPLARRWRSRDPFEYRRTILVPEAECPARFEKTVVGDTVACINFAEQSACFIRYPELAKAERAAFEAQWQRALAHERAGGSPVPEQPVVIPLGTKILSSVREFVLSGRSIITFVVLALLSGALTYGLYQNARALNLQRIRDRSISIVATGALQFDAADVAAIKGPDDAKRMEYAKLVSILNLIRRSNDGVVYAYIMRATDDPTKLSFIADADSLYPNEKNDLNHDEKIDEADMLNYPGETYDISRFPQMAQGLQQPYADSTEQTDQWGTFISSAAPIKDPTGRSVALFGVDILASDLDRLTVQSFTPVYFFIALFLLFVFVRFAALNKSLLKELVDSVSIRRFFVWGVAIAILFTAIGYGFYLYTFHLIVNETGQRLMSIAVTSANQFDPKDLDQLHWARDMNTEEYQRVFVTLNRIRNENKTSDIHYIYVMRPTVDPTLFEFVADADSNYNLPYLSKTIFGDTDPYTQADTNLWPGKLYDDWGYLFRRGVRQPSAGITSDQWGEFISGVAPISYKGEFVGLVGLDSDLSNMRQKIMNYWFGD